LPEPQRRRPHHPLDHPRAGRGRARPPRRGAARRQDPPRRAGARPPHRRPPEGRVVKIATLRAWSILKVGVRSILRNTTRSILTVLGIVIGVACVIAMNAVGSGASKSIQSNISALGTNFIMVFPGA